MAEADEFQRMVEPSKIHRVVVEPSLAVLGLSISNELLDLALEFVGLVVLVFVPAAFDRFAVSVAILVGALLEATLLLRVCGRQLRLASLACLLFAFATVSLADVDPSLRNGVLTVLIAIEVDPIVWRWQFDLECIIRT